MVSDNQSTQSHLRPKFFGLGNVSRLKLIAALILLCGCGALVFYLCILSLLGPVDVASSTEEVVQITHGMTATRIGSLLAEKGLIKSVLLFRLASTLGRSNRSLKAGEYVLSKNMGTFQILNKIAAGEAALFPFTIPEGVTLSQIAGYWEERKFGSANDFAEALRDPIFRKKYDIDSDDLEGYLFPDTYMLPHGISERDVIDEMLRQFSKNMSHLMAARADLDVNTDINLSRHQIVSLASIIEKEAMVAEERPIISAVFHNRLRRGRKLESCATVLYSLGYPRRKLTNDDLRNTDSPYNTYIHTGLPPGPICNPGRDSIAAALAPSEDGFLYFVSKNDGTHYFTASYNDFLKAKRRYRDS